MKPPKLDESKLTLEFSKSRLNIPGATGFILTGGYADYDLDDAFHIDLLTSLLQGCRLFLTYETHVQTLPRKRRFFKDIPLTYYPHEFQESVKAYIVENKPDWQWVEKIVPRTWDGKTYPNIVLFVYSETPDPTLIKLNAEREPESWFRGYTKGQNIGGFEEIPRIFQHRDPTAAITICNASEIFIVEEHYPVAQLIERIQAVADKHNKVLEVDL
ncbi:MAG: hypothetical protein VB051_00230 [Candidatus Pelethousia sp.]|nr:hypothetical protein [Candidatus Pelethousia sp.]